MNRVIHPDTGFDWKSNIQEYSFSKTAYNFGFHKPLKSINQNTINQIEKEFNPILQTYSDQRAENQAREKEQRAIIDTLSRNKVNE